MAGTPCLRHVHVLLAIIKFTTNVAFSYEITVDVERPLRKLDHFWRSTGFWYSEQTIIRWAMQRIALNPPLPHTEAHQFVLSKDQQLNLAYVSSVPNGGIQQIRIHWMLEMVSAVDFEGEPQYNFTKLDKLIDLLWINGLQPGFELMGSVSNYFSNFEDKRQVIEWRNFVYQTAKRYIAKYGLEVVSQWNFETWNEPNNKDFDNVTMSIQGFLNYYDASSEGLQAASIYLRFGGPGDSCHSHPHSPYCWAMLQHCYNGTNYFTGERGVRLDFIALHKKGGGHSLPILQQEVQTVGEIQQRFPRFRILPVFNDEADPLVGWSRPLPWRADVTYAAMVVKVISQHQDLLLAQPNSTINYTLLSNDNAFLSYHPYPFRQRTLTARFQINNTKPPHVQLLRKPVLTVMGLLALLGETQVLAHVVGESESTTTTTIGVLASTHTPVTLGTSDSWQTTVMVFNSDDNSSSTATDHVSVTVRGLTGQKGLLYMTYYMDNNVSNPYQLWQNMGSPDYPTPMQFRQLRNAEDPQIGGPFPITVGDTLALKAKLAVPSVFLIHVCAQPNALPDQVNGLRVIGITNGQVLIVWNDRCLNSKCIKTFEVEFSRDGKEFFRVNGQDIFFTSFVYSPVNLEVSGIYRVRALDYWGRPGEYSLTKRYFDEH